MKKILALCLVLILALSMSFTSLAAGFVESPSLNPAPEIVEDETTNEDEDCEADVIITPYSERDTLPDDVRKEMEEAYEQISGALDISDLSDALEDYCKDNNIDTANLKVSDLFDISYEGCDEHDEHGYFTITFKAETLANFVALLHLTDNGWDMIENAKVVHNGTALKFKIDDFSPFAIIVDTSKATSSPQTGDNSDITMWVVILSACILALGTTLFFIFKRKKA